MYFGLKMFWLMNLLLVFRKMVICAKSFMIATSGDKSRQAEAFLAIDSKDDFDL